jgi:hypothetical protein
MTCMTRAAKGALEARVRAAVDNAVVHIVTELLPTTCPGCLALCVTSALAVEMCIEAAHALADPVVMADFRRLLVTQLDREIAKAKQRRAGTATHAPTVH